MSFLKKHAEVIFSYITGALAILFSLIIFVNVPLIHKLKKDQKVEMDIDNLWDFIMAFFSEVIKVLSRFIGGFPIVSGIIILLFGILLVFIARTLSKTTRYDYDISIFYLVLGIIFFLLTIILMTQVYSFFAIIFIIPFVVHIGYIAYKDELNPNHRKEHYLWIIFSYGISYFITQLALYARIDGKEIAPIDVLSINSFFVNLWLLGQMAIWNFLFLRRALPVTESELRGDGYNRSEKRSFTTQTKAQIKDLQHRTTEFTRNTRRSIDIEKIRAKRDQFVQKWNDIVQLEEDDIPNWMRKPKWLKAAYVQVFCGLILLFFTLIELNNRNGLFMSGEWKLSQTQYVYEWVSLFILLIIIVIYIITTFTNYLKDKYTTIQLFMISVLFFKLVTEFFVILFHGLLLSIFITPILVLMLIPVIIAFIIQLKDKKQL